ncbi:LGFP repeat-containing protein [Mycolicibacterium sp. 22603]|uniref:LGFP repeat-containing protein n=1 Tax=Mycolicibacterium sp. 22603 TaxID=3453950 RepID=UPI003F8335A7
MTRQRTRLGSIAGRAAAVLVSAGLMAATVLLAPQASATPEGDADAAITAAWDTAGGGAEGPLGPKDGGVYPAGPGFGQNFAGGKIFFTPQTGAHIMSGAILEKYEALGGPTGDLGFPTIDEGPGRAADSRNVTFNAPDNPVIFWTPGTGARVVRGAINSAWDALGGSAGVLGVPADDETTDGDVVSQKFTGGQISWDRKTRAFTTTPPELAAQLGAVQVPSDAASAIAAARRAAGGELGPLGAEDGAQYAIGADGVGQNYAGGKIFYSPQTGANVVTGQILAKYESVGGPTGDLGFPTASEADGGLAPQSAVVPFAAEDKPVIFWTPDFGAVIVRGAMNAAWQKLGGATGELGAPKSDQTDNGGVINQQFNGGSISWDKAANRFSTEPAGLQSQLAGLQVPGADAPQGTADGPQANGGSDSGDKWYTWRWWWLLGLIPLVGLVAVIAVAVLRNRRSADQDRFDDDLDDDPYERGYYGYDQREDQREDRGDRREEQFDADHDGGYGPPPQDPWASLSPVGAASSYTVDPVDTGADEYDSDTDADDFDADPFVDGGAEPDRPAELLQFDDDEDDVDTAPTRIETLAPQPTESVFAEADFAEPDVEQTDFAQSDFEQSDFGASDFDADVFAAEPVVPAPEPEVTGGRHAAAGADDDDDDAGWTSMRLATTDRYRAPEGYPIKADTKTGLYWAPGSRGYRDTEAEIWFSSEEFARANGFVRAD